MRHATWTSTMTQTKTLAARPNTSPTRAMGLQNERSTFAEHAQAMRIHHQYNASLPTSRRFPHPSRPALRAYSAERTSPLAAHATGIPQTHHTRQSFSDFIGRSGRYFRAIKRGPRRPLSGSKRRALQAGVLLRDHAVEHGNRQHGVDAGSHAGQLGRRGFLFRAHRDDAERFLLVRPDDEPDVEPHDHAHPHTEADRGEGLLQHQRLSDVAV